VFAGATKVVVAKGKKIVELDLKGDPAAWKTLAEIAIGPTGNLRAPAIKTGTTWLVGFSDEAYAARFG
jgi:hypothetical protein